MCTNRSCQTIMMPFLSRILSGAEVLGWEHSPMYVCMYVCTYVRACRCMYMYWYVWRYVCSSCPKIPSTYIYTWWPWSGWSYWHKGLQGPRRHRVILVRSWNRRHWWHSLWRRRRRLRARTASGMGTGDDGAGFACMYVCMYVCMYECMDGCMDGWM